jgi:hypothetical protein
MYSLHGSKLMMQEFPELDTDNTISKSSTGGIAVVVNRVSVMFDDW